MAAPPRAIHPFASISPFFFFSVGNPLDFCRSVGQSVCLSVCVSVGLSFGPSSVAESVASVRLSFSSSLSLLRFLLSCRTTSCPHSIGPRQRRRLVRESGERVAGRRGRETKFSSNRKFKTSDVIGLYDTSPKVRLDKF